MDPFIVFVCHQFLSNEHFLNKVNSLFEVNHSRVLHNLNINSRCYVSAFFSPRCISLITVIKSNENIQHRYGII